MTEKATEKGLADVVAAETAISDIDGKLGKLFYVGYDIHDLAQYSTFEETVHLLHKQRLPSRDELEETASLLTAERELDDWLHGLMPTFAEVASPMSMLRTSISAASAYDPDGWDQSAEANERKALRLVARFPTLIATFHRLRSGLEPVPSNPKLPHAANFLYMLSGTEPDEEAARAFDICLILHADHTMNASTFVARVVASTLADMHSAITAAIAALKGPLHGGANEAVMKMLEQIGEVDRVEKYIVDRLARKDKIMGFGHRVYKTEDPRATHLRRLSRELGQRAGDTRWYELSERIEKVVMEQKGLYPNVDFYAASVYHYLGIPTDLFTCVFAASRVSGWSAHVREQLADNRLIRPESDYIGPRSQSYVPVEER
ncbi:MAG TPA: citrate synthase [Actinomycetota bacterium]|nr:citrate synthase [Actinomycetota bacterium]